jgi:hypothetical protein
MRKSAKADLRWLASLAPQGDEESESSVLAVGISWSARRSSHDRQEQPSFAANGTFERCRQFAAGRIPSDVSAL